MIWLEGRRDSATLAEGQWRHCHSKSCKQRHALHFWHNTKLKASALWEGKWSVCQPKLGSVVIVREASVHTSETLREVVIKFAVPYTAEFCFWQMELAWTKYGLFLLLHRAFYLNLQRKTKKCTNTFCILKTHTKTLKSPYMFRSTTIFREHT
jgi:hypothetical protein